ncbi:MAG: patatin-like phospholipase family protein [Vicingus serpentipes]|nr:patatin-like phospholipase family protein [Vicingus serpentipes]
MLFFWVIIFGIVNKSIAAKYGIPYLFLAPEYLGDLSFWSYTIMGFSIGGFVMAFNITSYVVNSTRFPFVAALKNPFVRYCINNSLFPLLFMVYYIYQVVLFHVQSEHTPLHQIVIFILGVVIGYSINVIFSLTYFLTTNKNIFKALGILPDIDESKTINSLFSRDEELFKFLKRKRKWHIESYLYTPFQIKLARDISHYDKNMLKSIIKQNHLNASVFEIVIFASLIVLGLFSENPFFVIPAGASVMLFFTIIFILTSAFYTWLKGWSTIVFIGLFILINLLSKQPFFSYANKAYGLNYNTEKADYSIKTLDDFRSNIEQHEKDKKNTINILNNWAAKNKKNGKPKIVFINTSGGGSRSTFWTFYSLQHTDSLLNGELFKHIHLITGSSGGMIGASYFRELYLEKDHLKASIYDKSFRMNTAKDLLNPIAFSIATNDLFIRLKKFKDGDYTYTKDRGYAFERQLLLNTDNLLNKRLGDYTLPEQQARIPIMILSPTVINDGRRMLISAQPISFLSNNIPMKSVNNQPIVENFEFRRMFKNQNPDNLKITSALRMSATFPYIMPSVSLPSEPLINVMDAGMRDNYGTLTTFKYIYTFKSWINENTSGVIIINYRDKLKLKDIEDNPLKSISENFAQPIGSLYGNLFPVQDYNLDDMAQYLSYAIDEPIDIIDFELDNNRDEISLSWHLTTKEKEKILNSIYSDKNQLAIQRLLELLNN